MRWYLIVAAGLMNFCFIQLNAQSGTRLSREEYIELYSDLAMREMLRSGVPASITLAQGMLESDNGNSSLARKSNNHFGIKCHNDWQGKKVHHNDDRWHECFRKYKTVYDSYVDHSDFLKNTPRYAFLFKLNINDYHSWAKGLKKAGYATSRTYADMLIRIIEENDLHRYDLLALEEGVPDQSRKEEKHLAREESASGRVVKERNRIDYIVVHEGDNWQSLRKEMDLMRNELYRYNDLAPTDDLHEGEVLYLQPKRNRAARGNDYHTVKEGETMWDISQEYGIKLEKLYQKNNMAPGTEPEPGDRISLRKRVKGKLFPLPIEENQDSSNKKIRIEFDDN